MNTIVMKFGGTSVAGTEKLRNIADIVIKEVKNNKIIVVLSAMAGETNKLQSFLDDFESQYSLESDLVLTSGEQVTIGLLSAELKNRGVKSIPLLGWQIPIITDNSHEKAKILNIDNKRIQKFFEKNDKNLNNAFYFFLIHFLRNSGYDIINAKDHPIVKRFQQKNPELLSDLSKIFESDFILNKDNFTTSYDKKVMSQFIAELVRYHFPDVKSFSVAKDVFS